jgi:hypothetical protein
LTRQSSRPLASSDGFSHLIDGLGHLPADHCGANLLFQIIIQRHEGGLIMLAARKAKRNRPSIFNNDILRPVTRRYRTPPDGKGLPGARKSTGPIDES